jgi:NAD-dependent SIR2 family protein deacetylase
MDPRDRLRARLAGSSCTACGASTHLDRIHLLARRDELVFVRVGCDACGSEALAIVMVAEDDPERPLRTDAAAYGEFGPMDEVRFAHARAVETDDVLAMRLFLAGFHGDVRTLVGGAGAGNADQPWSGQGHDA